MNSFSCVITGHRPTRFKFKYNEKDKRCQRIKKCLQEQLIRLYHQGVRCFWVGGAMGVDMWAAELLLRMKEQQAYQDVELCLALPFEGYNADWDDWHRKRMDFICRYAEKVLVLGEMPSSESYKKRNYYMVEQAGHMIAVYDNAHNMRSGTQQTVNYAKKKGLQIIYILYMIYGKSQKSLNFLCFCGYYNRQMSAKYYNGQILKNIFLYNYIAG